MNKNLFAAEAGDTETFNMPKSPRGIVHFNASATSGTVVAKAEVRLQGRLSSEQGWVDVLLDGTADYADVTDTIPSLTFQDIQIFPEMRANVTTFTYLSATIKIIVST